MYQIYQIIKLSIDFHWNFIFVQIFEIHALMHFMGYVFITSLVKYENFICLLLFQKIKIMWSNEIRYGLCVVVRYLALVFHFPSASSLIVFSLYFPFIKVFFIFLFLSVFYAFVNQGWQEPVTQSKTTGFI